MKFFTVVAILCTFALGLGQNLKNVTYPECPEPNYNNDVAMQLVETLEELRPYILTGYPPLDVPILDPYGPAPYIVANVDDAGLEVFVIGLNQTIIYNLYDVVICDVNLDYEVEDIIVLDFRVADLVAEGLFDLNGENMGIPVGNYTLNVYDARFVGMGFLVETVNGTEEILQVTDLGISLDHLGLELNYECFTGCGNLTESAEASIAEDIFRALWAYYEFILTEHFESLLNRILDDIPITETPPVSTEGPAPPKEELVEKRHRVQFALDRLSQKRGKNFN